MRDTELLSIVVPVYLNAETVELLNQDLVRVMASVGRPWETIFVIDGSPDGSLELLERADQPSTRRLLISLRRNQGQNWAVLVGLSQARGEKIIVMDADLQDPPDAIPRLLDALASGTDVVFAGRRGGYESRSRLVTSMIFKRLLAGITRGRVPADAGLFMIMRSSVAKALLQTRARHPHVVSMIARLGIRAKSIPVERRRRPAGRSSYTSMARLTLALRALAGLVSANRWTPPVMQQVEALLSTAVVRDRS